MKTFWGSVAIGVILAALAIFEEQLELRTIIGVESYLGYVVGLTAILFVLVVSTCFIANRNLKSAAI